MQSNSNIKTILIALGLCLFFSVIVSSVYGKFKHKIAMNKLIDKKSNILIAAGLMKKGDKIDVLKTFKEKVEEHFVDIQTAKYAKGIDSERYSARKIAAASLDEKNFVPKSKLTGMPRLAKVYPIYFMRKSGKISKIIIPIHGKGLWSTLYGFMAINADYETIEGITFYEHAETPGLGGEVDNPKWKASWVGKKAYDKNGKVMIQIIKGSVIKSRPDAKYKIDGLSGATLTSRGTSDLVRFWLGKEGFKPTFEKLKAGNL